MTLAIIFMSYHVERTKIKSLPLPIKFVSLNSPDLVISKMTICPKTEREGGARSDVLSLPAITIRFFF